MSSLNLPAQRFTSAYVSFSPSRASVLSSGTLPGLMNWLTDGIKLVKVIFILFIKSTILLKLDCCEELQMHLSTFNVVRISRIQASKAYNENHSTRLADSTPNVLASIIVLEQHA